MRTTIICLLLCFGINYLGESQHCSGNCMKGFGQYTFASGAKYIGFFQSKLADGQGVYYYPNGDKYVGNWVAGKRDGQGILYRKKKVVLVGVWKADKYIGVEKEAKGCVEGDCKNGTGTYIYKDYTKYIGNFKDTKANGYGKCYYSNGDIYIGEWRNHNFNGIGTFYSSTGVTKEGEWKDGVFIKHTSNAYQDTYNSEPTTKIWALIVGIGRYPHMKPLKFTDDDAYHFYSFLKSPEGGALEDEQIKLLIDEDATKENILKTLGHISQAASQDDVILFYFSGHGLVGGFVPFDYINKPDLVQHKELLGLLERSQAKSKVVFADACHAGSFTTKGKANEAIAHYYEAFKHSEGGLALLLSSKADESSIESQGLRRGIFSHFLIRGLKGSGDVNNDKIITIQELFTYVKANVLHYSNGLQTPILRGKFDKNIPLGVIR